MTSSKVSEGQGPLFKVSVKKHMKECPNECRLNGKSLEISIEYYIEISIEILRSSMEKTKLTHEDTVTIKDLDDAYAAATDELIAELSEETAE